MIFKSHANFFNVVVVVVVVIIIIIVNFQSVLLKNSMQPQELCTLMTCFRYFRDSMRYFYLMNRHFLCEFLRIY